MGIIIFFAVMAMALVGSLGLIFFTVLFSPSKKSQAKALQQRLQREAERNVALADAEAEIEAQRGT